MPKNGCSLARLRIKIAGEVFEKQLPLLQPVDHGEFSSIIPLEGDLGK